MKESEIRERAFAMPLTSPAYPPGPYRFRDREFLIITYRTDPELLRRVVPEPLQSDEPLVRYEFIRMPDSTGFGEYTETGQVIPVSFRGRKGGYSHCMFLDDHPPIAGGRELHLGSLQPMGLYAANSLFVSDYLTTPGQGVEADHRMIRELGFEVAGAPER